MVALSGQVGNILTHDLAIRAATTVRGVRAIDDDLSVRRSNHSDTQIEREVETALALDPATEHWEIEVDSWFERYVVGDAAAHVIGVSEVRSNVDVDENLIG